MQFIQSGKARLFTKTLLQRGCTWLVQFIAAAPGLLQIRGEASKGLHMVSAVHQCSTPARSRSGHRLQRGCTWLVQFIRNCLYGVHASFLLQRGCTWLVQFIAALLAIRCTLWRASKGLHMVSAVHPWGETMRALGLYASKGLHMVSVVHPWN